MTRLAALNASAREKAVRLDQVDWQRAIHHDRLWVPPSLCPLSYLPIYQDLSEDEKLCDNQLYALALAEQFAFLEVHILNRVIDALRRHPSVARELAADPELGEALEHLYAEEVTHTEMFWRLCEKAAPQRYPSRDFWLLPLTPLRSLLISTIFNRPLAFPFWAWVGALFEEKTIEFARAYEATPCESIDPTFTRVHILHRLDEARHFALERELVARFWPACKGLKRRLNLALFQSFIANFVHPIESTSARFEKLIEQHPRLAALRPQLRAQAREFPKNKAWLQASFSPEVLPGCFKLFEQDGDIRAIVQKLRAQAQ
jgi:hypothetical protein